mmetsp:Transcript_35836/g.92613  ORF Transcript_35836/g.92613 Transcript_35836/m.92613 type:complete len:86 (+) Transcript_35836:59-316(+)
MSVAGSAGADFTAIEKATGCHTRAEVMVQFWKMEPKICMRSASSAVKVGLPLIEKRRDSASLEALREKLLQQREDRRTTRLPEIV